MFIKVKLLSIIFAVTFPTYALLAKQATVSPDPVINTTDYGPDSRYVHAGNGLVNPVTGAAVYEMPLFTIKAKSGLSYSINLHYCGPTEKRIVRDNSEAPTGIMGLGWHLAASAIFVDAKNTTSLSDDEHYLKEPNGVISKIIRSGASSADYTYQLKNYPYWKIKVEYSGFNISVWKLIQTDGTVYQYGGSENTRRFYPCDNNSITPCGNGRFIYQWDLDTISDANGGKIYFVYKQDQQVACSTITYTIPKDEVNIGWYGELWAARNGWTRTIPGSVYAYFGFPNGNFEATNTNLQGYYQNGQWYPYPPNSPDKNDWFYRTSDSLYVNMVTGAIKKFHVVTTGRSIYIPPPEMLKIMYFDQRDAMWMVNCLCTEWEYFLVRPPIVVPGGDPIATYIRTSHLDRIISDRDDQICFEWLPKEAAELGTRTLIEDAHRVGAISLFVGDKKKERVVFTYSGDSGQVAHVKYGNKSAKRLLTGIKVHDANNVVLSKKYFFYTNSPDNTGLLARIVDGMTGKDIIYSYKLIDDRNLNDVKYKANVVEKVTQYSGTGSVPSVVTTYEYCLRPYLPPEMMGICYGGGCCDQYVDESGLVYWKQVSVSSGTQTGKTVFRYEIDTSTHLLGECKSITVFNTSDKIVSKKTFEYGTKLLGPTGNQWYLPYLIKTTDSLDGVRSYSGTPLPKVDPKNGIPAQQWAKNSDNTYLVKQARFAYEYHPTEMGSAGACMLSQPASTKSARLTSYDMVNGAVATGSMGGNIVNATYTVWKNQWPGVSAVWRPFATYAWESPMSSSGLSTNTFYEFSESNPTANGWRLMSTIDKYDGYGNVLQTSDAYGVSSSIVYNDSTKLPIATVANAKRGEVFFSSFEEPIAWSDGYNCNINTAVQYVTNKRKNGGKAGKITNTSSTYMYIDGPWQSLDAGIPAAKDYTFSCWVYTTGSNARIHFFASVGGPVYEMGPPAHLDYVDYKETSQAINKWVLLKKNFRAPAQARYFMIRLDHWGADRPLGAGRDVYYDDLKFYPSDAMMNCTYYDTLWQAANLAVDPNENPGRLIIRDEWGRPKEVWKVDRTKGVEESSYKMALVEKKEYHLMNNPTANEVILISPNGGEVIPYGSLPIYWRAGAQVSSILLRYSKDGGSSYTDIVTLSGDKAKSGEYVWSNPPFAFVGASCKILIKNTTSPSNTDCSEKPFTINIIDRLNPGQRLHEYYPWLTSPNGNYSFVFQGDGNVVLYNKVTGLPQWSSLTAQKTVRECAMQTDGNFVIYGPADSVYFNTQTHIYPGAVLTLRDDGKVVILYNGVVKWCKP